jgi:fructoselysine 3-epimerase
MREPKASLIRSYNRKAGRLEMSSENGISIANSNMHYFYYSLDDFIKAQKKLGLKNIEIYGSTPHFWIDQKEHEDGLAIKIKIESERLKLVAFTPNPYNYSLCAIHEEQARNTLGYYENCIQVTAQMGLNYFILTPVGGCIDTGYDEAWNRCRKNLIHLCKRAESYKVNLAFSTASRKFAPILNSLSELIEMKKQVGAENLKIALDVVTMSQLDEKIEQWFTAFSKDIVHVHFSDGTNDNYQICGKGCYPIKQYIQELDHCGYEGFLGLNVPNIKYWYNPYKADKDNLRALRTFFSEN